MAAALIGGGIGALGSIIGGGKQASAASAAAQAQVQAAQIAAQTELQKFEEGKQAVQPFIDYGQQAIGPLQALTGTGPGATAASVLSSPLASIPDASYTPFDMSIENLRKTPGFQFQLDVGTKMAENQLTPQGRGIGGATGVALEQFGTGLAETTYLQQLQAYMSQYQQRLAGIQQTQTEKAQTFNQLTSQIGTGASTGTSLLGAAVNTGGQIAQAQLSGGASQAAGIVGSANALAGGITGATGNIASAFQLANLQQGGLFGSTPDYSNPAASAATNAYVDYVARQQA